MGDLKRKLRYGVTNAFSRDRSEGIRIRLEVVFYIMSIVALAWPLFHAVRANGTLESQIAGLNKENAELRTTVDTNAGTVDALKKLNSDLTRRNIELERAQPQPPDDLNSPPMRNNTSSLTLAAGGDGIDLNVADDPAFGMGPDLGYDADELRYEGNGTLNFGWEAVSIARVVAGETARYATCAIAQGFQPVDFISVNTLDDRTCLRLDSGRVATIGVVTHTRQAVELSIRVWELP